MVLQGHNMNTIQRKVRTAFKKHSKEALQIALIIKALGLRKTKFKNLWESLSEITYRIHGLKGFIVPSKNLNDAEQIALIHSELSEALEGLRKDLNDDKLTHRKMVEVELADAVIRIMNYAKARNLDVAGAIIEKSQYNATRPYRHGGKKF
jgi:hypothetical protein